MGLMIQLQNSYQANAQVITTTSTLFTALLNIFVQSA
jgi:flagellar hook-associated protein FlgK